MSERLVALVLLLPLAGVVGTTALAGRPRAQRVVGVTLLAATLACAVSLLLVIRADGPFVVEVGGWTPGIGTSLVADLLAAIMCVVAAVILLVVLVHAIGHTATDDLATWFHPVYQALAVGVLFAFLTGDLFSLFVSFEVLLVSSFVLVLLGSGAEQVRPGTTYVVVSLLGSTLFVTAVGLVYAATGTVDMATIGAVMADQPVALRTALGLLLLVVFGTKAAMFPLFQWLPDSYPTTPTAITAVFAGLLTKVGVYGLLRTWPLLFPDPGGAATLLLWLAAATMVLGVLGAIVQDDVKRILSFHIISQIGYMLVGIGLTTLAGLAAAIFYVVHHILVKTSLFLVHGIVEQRGGSGRLRDLGGMARTAPWTALLFALPALSLAGLPPFSGFVAKLALVDAGLAEARWIVMGISIAVSLLTLFSMSKVWSGAFWGEDPTPQAGVARVRPSMVWATAALVACTVGVAVAAGPLLQLTAEAAVQVAPWLAEGTS